MPIDRTRHTWLDHDSFVECNLMIWDEFELEEAMRDPRNPLGKVHAPLKEPVLQEMLRLPYVREADKVMLRRVLA